MLFEIFNCTKNVRCANATLSLLGILAFVILNGCSADYDTFGTSDYRNLEDYIRQNTAWNLILLPHRNLKKFGTR